MTGFTNRINRCSFLADGLNPFHREGVYLDKVDVQLWKDEKQPATAAIIEQVVQVSLLRVILPWMIGRAFERLSDPEFIQLLGDNVNLPVPKQFQVYSCSARTIKLGELLKMAAGGDPKKAPRCTRKKSARACRRPLAEQFSKYNLRGKTWASLTKSSEDPRRGRGVGVPQSRGQRTVALRRRALQASGADVRGHVRVLPGADRRLGVRGRAAARHATALAGCPANCAHILMGKMVPCFALSVGQTLFLLVASHWLFGIRWGPDDWSLPEQMALAVAGGA